MTPCVSSVFIVELYISVPLIDKEKPEHIGRGFYGCKPDEAVDVDIQFLVAFSHHGFAQVVVTRHLGVTGHIAWRGGPEFKFSTRETPLMIVGSSHPQKVVGLGVPQHGDRHPLFPVERVMCRPCLHNCKQHEGRSDGIQAYTNTSRVT